MDNKDLSELKKKLPAIPGIHGRGEMPTSVVMVLITEVNGEYHFVLARVALLQIPQVFVDRGPNGPGALVRFGTV